MDDSLYFSDQHLALRDMVRSFAAEEVAPVAGHFDECAEFPWENVKKMGELGLLGVPWPEEYGGSGFDTISYMIAIHEMAKVDASHAITISAHTTLGTSPSSTSATTSSGSASCRSSPAAGCSAASASRRRARGATPAARRRPAVRKNGHYVLNGSKRFITHAGVGEIFVVTAVTDPHEEVEGDQLVCPDRRTPSTSRAREVGIGHDEELPKMAGFRSGKKEDKLGWRASGHARAHLEDVEVPVENGSARRGWGSSTS
jgi:butyryl-CoA dehydrogenase